jgi:arabinogalactan endo-1,4-beta-galactosidase
VALVETSYPFTLNWNDWTNNHIGDTSQLHPDFPATNEGQRAFIASLRALTDSLGTGLVYWGGELVAYKGPQAQDGSPYENQALFDFSGKALPALYEIGVH